MKRIVLIVDREANGSFEKYFLLWAQDSWHQLERFVVEATDCLDESILHRGDMSELTSPENGEDDVEVVNRSQHLEKIS